MVVLRPTTVLRCHMHACFLLNTSALSAIPYSRILYKFVPYKFTNDIDIDKKSIRQKMHNIILPSDVLKNKTAVHSPDCQRNLPLDFQSGLENQGFLRKRFRFVSILGFKDYTVF